MQITIEIPDEVAQRLNGEWGSLSRRLLEVFVAEVYRYCALSAAEVRRILQLPSRLETHAFLQRMGVYFNYDSEELERDIQTLEQLRNP